MKRIDIIKQKFENSLDKFCCPTCGSNFIVEDYSLICGKRHTFDFSAKGYVNFLTKTPHDNYSPKLFESRRTVYENGFFHPCLR